MRKLAKGEEPPELVANRAEWTARYIEADNPRPSVWRNDELVQALKNETLRKCAYCEANMMDVSYAHVEHILPKSVFPHLVVDWENLTIACQTCNTEKGDYYDASVPLIHPYNENPLDHFEFWGPVIQEKNGNLRAERTIDQIDLCRAPLVVSRAMKIDFVRRLIQRWIMAESDGEKETAAKVVRRELRDDREFVETLRAYARAKGFPVDQNVVDDPSTGGGDP